MNGHLIVKKSVCVCMYVVIRNAFPECSTGRIFKMGITSERNDDALRLHGDVTAFSWRVCLFT